MTTATQLTGTDKQIAWATDIRSAALLALPASYAAWKAQTERVVDAARPYVDEDPESGTDVEVGERRLALADKIMAALPEVPDAEFWIDHRGLLTSNDTSGGTFAHLVLAVEGNRPGTAPLANRITA